MYCHFVPHRSLSQDAWPIGLAITGDLEEDLLRWEAAETQISEPENTSLEEEEAVLESDSDDGLPLPSARPRPPFVPPLTLCTHINIYSILFWLVSIISAHPLLGIM